MCLTLETSTSLRCLTFLLGTQTVILTVPALLDFFLSADASICFTMAFPPLGNSDHVVVSVIIFTMGCPISSHNYDYSHSHWDGLGDHLRDIPWEDVFKLCASVAANEFCEWVQVQIDVYIPHRK